MFVDLFSQYTPWKLLKIRWKLMVGRWTLPFYNGFFSGDMLNFGGRGGAGVYFEILLRCSHKGVQRGMIVQRRGFWVSIYHQAAPTQSVHRHWSGGCTKNPPNGIAWDTSLRIQTPPGWNRIEDFNPIPSLRIGMDRGNPFLRTYLDS